MGKEELIPIKPSDKLAPEVCTDGEEDFNPSTENSLFCLTLKKNKWLTLSNGLTLFAVVSTCVCVCVKRGRGRGGVPTGSLKKLRLAGGYI